MGKKAVGMLVGYVLLAVIGIPVLVTAALGGFREEHMTEAKALYGLEDIIRTICCGRGICGDACPLSHGSTESAGSSGAYISSAVHETKRQ